MKEKITISIKKENLEWLKNNYKGNTSKLINLLLETERAKLLKEEELKWKNHYQWLNSKSNFKILKEEEEIGETTLLDGISEIDE